MACERVMQIIKSLKTFTKLDQAEFQEADINEGIRSVLVLTSNLWKRKITIHEDYGELPLVKCFPGMLNQVFMNIVVNAVQAIGENGDIFIKTWKDEKSVNISIRDTGCGIGEENLQRIFENGYTTKSGSLGMGLGLAISRSIINKHEGDIRVTSKVGEGTEFTVIIPLQV
jgi:signal transduction histidine kinase